MLLVGTLFGAAPVQAKDGICDSVVKILATQRKPDFIQPWAKAAPEETSGSGVVIAGKRILTNAHVVTYATQIFVQANQSSEKLAARVVASAPAIDLAVLAIDDESFFHAHPPLPFGEGLPNIKDQVNVYGYPIGGEQLSITQGIVSRIDYTQYFYQSIGLWIQIDAAINPGNSGGPAIAEGRIVGLVFSKITGADNIGYLIAVEEIQGFLQDIEDGHYEGKPLLPDGLQTTENNALRAKLRLPKDSGGLMVTQPCRLGKACPLQAEDVITHIDGQPIDSLGQVKIHDGMRVSYQYLIGKRAVNGKIKLTILREGQPLAIEAPIRHEWGRVVQGLNGSYPRYFICGPMVFSAASQELQAKLSSEMTCRLLCVQNPLAQRLFDTRAFEDEELVILGYALFPHRIAKGYDHTTFGVVTRVNGTAVRNLAHLVELLRDASGEFVTIELAGRYETLVFRRTELIGSTEEILATEGIRRQGSEDLMKIWEAKK
jgi:S1-C subfamily serine protease